MKPPTPLGQALRDARLTGDGFTATDVERETTLPQAALAAIERGRTRPKPLRLWELAHLFDTPYLQLLKLAGRDLPARHSDNRKPVHSLLELASYLVSCDEADIRALTDELANPNREPTATPLIDIWNRHHHPPQDPTPH